MDISQYGPFANVITIASALIATFSMLLLKGLGRVRRWSWLITGAPPFLVTVGARGLSIALMAVTYVTISKTNYGWFCAAALLLGLFEFMGVARFDKLRKLHIVAIPVVGADGRQILDRSKKPLEQNVVVGLEADLRPEARVALAAARKQRGGLSVRQFMSGYGAQRVNDPEALWDPALLAKISSRLTFTLMCIVLFAVMALFWAAFVVEVVNR